MVLVTGDGHRWARTETLGGTDGALDRLVERLAGLAWAADTPAAGAPPHRYDFGPDPYERYRP